MKKSAILVAVVIFIVSAAPAGYCQDAFRKLGRGVANIVTCPVEFTKALGSSYESGGVYEAVTYGIFKGLIMTTVRAGLSFYEVVSFPIPLPLEYKSILQPEFAWEKE